jgi:uncharacterized protein YndB with AHSA1/START domain
MARQSHLTLTIARLFPVAPPVVFRAFDTPGELAQWWGPFHRAESQVQPPRRQQLPDRDAAAAR